MRWAGVVVGHCPQCFGRGQVWPPDIRMVVSERPGPQYDPAKDPSFRPRPIRGLIELTEMDLTRIEAKWAAARQPSEGGENGGLTRAAIEDYEYWQRYGPRGDHG